MQQYKEKNEYKELKEKLEIKRQSGWINLTEEEKQKIMDFSEEYIKALNKGKTEREVVKYVVNILEENGFVDIETTGKLEKGSKVYINNREKTIYAAVIGEDIFEGTNIVGGHLDSPRLDLKTMPLYEEDELALMKTQYYGGIKKYQWTTIPLALKGVVALTNGEIVEVNIGEDKQDPIFTITEILPHLGKKQLDKTGRNVVEGEQLNLIVGSIPYEASESIKLNILKILNEKYGIIEQDLTSAELQFVPAFEARSLGLDKSMIAGYGQDDKSCSFAALRAFIDVKETTRTNILILADKEEVGSMGNTGMYSQTFDYFVNEIVNKMGQNYPGAIDKIYHKSRMLSADVDAAYDPTYPEYYDKRNSSKIGHGVALNKYTGSGGKFGASDASAEYMAEVREIFENNNIKYQVTSMGKIDEGGGGTIAYILANKGIDVVDCGIALLSMHSPYEVSSKFDLYEVYKAYKAFYNSER